MPIPARHLVQNQAKLITVPLDAKLTHALALMIEYDFSQLPVVDVDFKPLGIVTTDSITRALLTLGTNVKELRVKDVFTKPPIFQADEDLLYLLDYLLKASAVFIVDTEGKLIGIITDYDTTQYFRQRAEDIVLVEDIESTLKSHLRAMHNALTEDTEELRIGVSSLNTTLDETRKRSHLVLKEFCKSKSVELDINEATLIIDKFFPLTDKARPFDNLTLSEYIQFAQKSWPTLGSTFNLPKSAWSEMMDAVRDIRNKLVHFRGTISPVERAKLRYCAEWYKTHQPTQKNVLPIEKSEASTPEQKSISFANRMTKLLTEPATKEEIEKHGYGVIPLRLNKANASLEKPSPSITISLDAAEKIFGRALPMAAREHIGWWTESKVKSRIWARYGWIVTNADFSGRQSFVTFQQLPKTTKTPIIPTAETND